MKSSYWISALVLTTVGLSCAKKDDGILENSQIEPLSATRLILQLPVPNNAYSVKDERSIKSSESNVRNLVSLIDSVAEPLKETEMHLDETVLTGEHIENNIHVVNRTLNTEIQGLRDDSNGIINWTYKQNGSTYFQGNTSNSSIKGELEFPATSAHAAFTVSWDSSVKSGELIKNVVIRQGATALLNFALTYPFGNNLPKVKLSGRINGNAEISGEWDFIKGGKYSEPGLSGCWDVSLKNITCPAQQGQ